MRDDKAKSYFVSGVLIALAGSVLFSTKAVLVKVAYRDTPVDAITLLTLRMVFSLPFFISSALVSSSKATNIRFTPRQWFLIAITGCLGYYVSSLLDFIGLQFVTAGIERLILFVYPTLVLLMSSLLFKEKIKGIQWIALLVTYAGLALAFLSEVDLQSSDNPNFYLGSLLIFICAFTYAAYIVGSGKLIPLVGAGKFNSYAMTFAALGVLSHFLLTSDSSLLDLPFQVYLYSFAMAVFATVVPSYLVSESIKRIGSDNAAIISSVGPVSTILMAYFILDEPVFISQMIGTTLILTGVLLIGKQKTK